MSLKGIQKAAIRAPQTFKAKFNLGDNTKDAVYIDSERRFQELETVFSPLETKKLHDESKKYFDSINGMLNHQIEFSKAVQEIYKPISGRVSDPNSSIPEGNPEGIRACEEYESIVRELQGTLAPELEMIQQRVIAPADELLTVIKAVQKTIVKRQHKQLDFDRHRATLKKLQDKKEKSLKDEKALYKAEADVELATQEFNYFNDLLKDELPKLFHLEREFIQPLFQSFYYMQLNVFYTLHEKMQNIDIGYFDLSQEVESAFEKKRGDIQEQVELLTIVHFKTLGGKKPSRFGGGGKLAIEGRSSTAVSRRRSNESLSSPPPPYSSSISPYMNESSSSSAMGRANSTGSSWGAAAKAKGAAPPPPKPKPSKFAGTPNGLTATVLYDYEAQAEGDLSFSTGDVIEITLKGATENEWWSGRLGGRQGQFPDRKDKRLIVLSGYPSSGKTYRTQQLYSYLVTRIAACPDLEHGRLTVVHISDHSLGLSREVYCDARTEKNARATTYSAVKRALGKNCIVLCDGMNYIKGFRYQMYCEAKTAGTGSTPISKCRDLNARLLADPSTDGGYPKDVFENLVFRYEEPNGMTRWDSPLFTVPYQDQTPPLEAIWEAVIGSDGKAKVVKPNLATVLAPASEFGYLYELDKTTQEIIQHILDWQKDHSGQGGSEIGLAGGALQLPVTSLSLPQLQRLRRQYFSLNRQHPLTKSRIRESFVAYLNDNFQ
ncbi:hypothetical protein MMC13_007948 [Lambiella insularis]|nr:hypothetical protein [Lambiella insularis]